MGTAIGKATVDDARKLASLLKGIGWFDAFNAGQIDELAARVRERLQQCLADGSHSVFVAEEQAGEITGYGSVHWLPYLFMSGPEGYVSELFVSASARGCQRLSLTNLRNRESYQRQFYLKAGWHERSEAANFIYVLD